MKKFFALLISLFVLCLAEPSLPKTPNIIKGITDQITAIKEGKIKLIGEK